MPLTSVPFHHTGRSPGTLRTLNTDKKRVSFLLPQPESSCPESKNFYRPWEPCDSENQSQHSQMPNPHLEPDPEAKENLAIDLISALYKKEHSELLTIPVDVSGTQLTAMIDSFDEYCVGVRCSDCERDVCI